MSKAVSRGQALQVSARVATQVNWEELDGERLQGEIINLSPEEFGHRITVFLKRGAKFFIEESKSISIDRSKPFNPAKFIYQGWAIEEEDERSLALTEIDLTKIRFKRYFRTSEEETRRFKETNYVPLDAKILQILWENQSLIPETWYYEWVIHFDGTILRAPEDFKNVLHSKHSKDSRYTLALCWDSDKKSWRWDYDSFDIDPRFKKAKSMCAVLENF